MYTYLILCGLTGEPIMPCGRGLRGFTSMKRPPLFVLVYLVCPWRHWHLGLAAIIFVLVSKPKLKVSFTSRSRLEQTSFKRLGLERKGLVYIPGWSCLTDDDGDELRGRLKDWGLNLPTPPDKYHTEYGSDTDTELHYRYGSERVYPRTVS